MSKALSEEAQQLVEFFYQYGYVNTARFVEHLAVIHRQGFIHRLEMDAIDVDWGEGVVTHDLSFELPANDQCSTIQHLIEFKNLFEKKDNSERLAMEYVVSQVMPMILGQVSLSECGAVSIKYISVTTGKKTPQKIHVVNPRALVIRNFFEDQGHMWLAEMVNWVEDEGKDTRCIGYFEIPRVQLNGFDKIPLDVAGAIAVLFCDDTFTLGDIRGVYSPLESLEHIYEHYRESSQEHMYFCDECCRIILAKERGEYTPERVRVIRINNVD